MMVLDGARRFGKPGPGGSWIEANLESVVLAADSPHVRTALMHGVTIPPLSKEHLAATHPVTAYLNHNRWVADCPDCRGAEFVFLKQPYFWCAKCCNAAVNYRWRPVIVPDERLRLAIERIVRARLLADNRNWRPGEELAALRTENREHGLPEEV